MYILWGKLQPKKCVVISPNFNDDLNLFFLMTGRFRLFIFHPRICRLLKKSFVYLPASSPVSVLVVTTWTRVYGESFSTSSFTCTCMFRHSWTLTGCSGSPLPQGYGFPVSQLFDMLLEMREQYGEILLKKWNITFRYRLLRDDQPLPFERQKQEVMWKVVPCPCSGGDFVRQ